MQDVRFGTPVKGSFNSPKQLRPHQSILLGAAVGTTSTLHPIAKRMLMR